MSDLRVFCIGATIAYLFVLLATNLTNEQPRDGAAAVIMIMFMGGAFGTALFGRRG